MTGQNVNAYPGYYVNMGSVIPVLKELLQDAEARRSKIVLVGGGENAKLDGAVASILALKELLYRLEVHGDLIPTPDPLKEVSNDAVSIALSACRASKKIIHGAALDTEAIKPIIQ